MLSIQNISEVAVTMKSDHGHRNWHVNVTSKGYPEANLERSRLKKCPTRTQSKSFRRIR